MSKLTKTKSGNYAKRTTIGSKCEARAFFKTRAEAEASAGPGEIVMPVKLSLKLADRLYGPVTWDRVEIANRMPLVPFLDGVQLSVPIEQIECFGVPTPTLAAYMVGIPTGGREVMVHASRAECEAAGVTPGPCND